MFPVEWPRSSTGARDGLGCRRGYQGLEEGVVVVEPSSRRHRCAGAVEPVTGLGLARRARAWELGRRGEGLMKDNQVEQRRRTEGGRYRPEQRLTTTGDH